MQGSPAGVTTTLSSLSQGGSPIPLQPSRQSFARGFNCLLLQATLRQRFSMALRLSPFGFAMFFYTSPPAPPLKGKGRLRTKELICNRLGPFCAWLSPSVLALSLLRLVEPLCHGSFFCAWLSPFPRGGASGDVDNHGSPEGHRLCEPYQNSDAGRHAPEVSYILPI